ncbi:MAG: DUF507 family protein [Acidobacteria bacterium]|nr:DUF507 family protein [Acidobacteriota bacterium]
MKLSREKVIQLSHRLVDELVAMDAVDFIEDRNTIRLEIVNILQDLLRQEEQMDQAARLKIDTQKRSIPEGSMEWETLYRKYYADELRKLGVHE